MYNKMEQFLNLVGNHSPYLVCWDYKILYIPSPPVSESGKGSEGGIVAKVRMLEQVMDARKKQFVRKEG